MNPLLLQSLTHLHYLEHMVLLQKLDLSNNHLQSLPSRIGCLASVTCLILDGNQVEQLPSEVGSLKNLKVLSLKNNSILKHAFFVYTLLQLYLHHFFRPTETDVYSHQIRLNCVVYSSS